MREVICFFIAVLAFLAVNTTVLAGQDSTQVREGFYMGFGLGGGTYGEVACCRERALAGYVSVGRAVRSNLSLGAEAMGWVKTGHGRSNLKTVSATAVMHFYLIEVFVLKAGAGLYRDPYSNMGLGLTTGFAWAFPPRAGWSIGPYASFAWGTEVNGRGAYALQFGVGLTWP